VVGFGTFDSYLKDTLATKDFAGVGSAFSGTPFAATMATSLNTRNSTTLIDFPSCLCISFWNVTGNGNFPILMVKVGCRIED